MQETEELSSIQMRRESRQLTCYGVALGGGGAYGAMYILDVRDPLFLVGLSALLVWNLVSLVLYLNLWSWYWRFVIVTAVALGVGFAMAFTFS